MTAPRNASPGYPLTLLGLVLLVLLWSGIGPRSRFTWFLETLPVFLAAPVLVGTYSRFRFTDLVYSLMA